MKKMRLFMLLSLLMVCLSGIASAHNWEWIVSGDKEGFYYSPGTAVRLTDNRQVGESGHVKAWLLQKAEYEDAPMRQEAITKMQKYFDSDLSNLHEVIRESEYKKVNGTIYCRDLRWYAYDYSGQCIATLNKPTKWDVVIPGTIGMKEYEYVLARAK